MFGYNDNTIRIQKNLTCTRGGDKGEIWKNTKGRYEKRKKWVNTDNTPVPKRKAQR